MDRGHLAARSELMFCPLRRLGTAGTEAEPSDDALSAVFMAAAPQGSDVLSFEEEETAILDATGSIGLDLTVAAKATSCFRDCPRRKRDEKSFP